MRIILIAVVVAFASCKTVTTAQNNSMSPHVIVYKTKTDYSKMIPVTLSGDRSEIVAYPAPSDVSTEQGYTTPTPLKGGYLLDNRGISKNSAFINMAYADYAALPGPPPIDEMYYTISDKEPFAEIYDCGSRENYKDVVKELNALITAGKLPKQCKNIK